MKKFYPPAGVTRQDSISITGELGDMITTEVAADGGTRASAMVMDTGADLPS